MLRFRLTLALATVCMLALNVAPAFAGNRLP
jgi:hypothetical protein